MTGATPDWTNGTPADALHRFLTHENTPEAYVSTHVDGEAVGYGTAVVHVRVDEANAQLEDEFPDGELHYRIPLDRAVMATAARSSARVVGRFSQLERYRHPKLATETPPHRNYS